MRKEEVKKMYLYMIFIMYKYIFFTSSSRVSMRKEEVKKMYLYMMKIMKPLRERVWPLMTIRKRRWGVRLSEELGEAETKIRGLEEFRKNLPPFWKNLNRPCPSQRNF